MRRPQIQPPLRPGSRSSGLALRTFAPTQAAEMGGTEAPDSQGAHAQVAQLCSLAPYTIQRRSRPRRREAGLRPARSWGRAGSDREQAGSPKGGRARDWVSLVPSSLVAGPQAPVSTPQTRTLVQAPGSPTSPDQFARVAGWWWWAGLPGELPPPPLNFAAPRTGAGAQAGQ